MSEDNKEVKKPIKATVYKPTFSDYLERAAKEQFKNVIVPKSHEIAHDTISSGIGMLNDFLQELLNRMFHMEGPAKSTTKSPTNYTLYSTDLTPNRTVSSDLGRRSSIEVGIVAVDDEDSARELVDVLRTCIKRYGKAKVADLYEHLTPKVPITFQDYKFGWNDAEKINYHKEYSGTYRNKYILDLPRPIDITDI